MTLPPPITDIKELLSRIRETGLQFDGALHGTFAIRVAEDALGGRKYIKETIQEKFELRGWQVGFEGFGNLVIKEPSMVESMAASMFSRKLDEVFIRDGINNLIDAYGNTSTIIRHRGIECSPAASWLPLSLSDNPRSEHTGSVILEILFDAEEYQVKQRLENLYLFDSSPIKMVIVISFNIKAPRRTPFPSFTFSFATYTWQDDHLEKTNAELSTFSYESTDFDTQVWNLRVPKAPFFDEDYRPGPEAEFLDMREDDVQLIFDRVKVLVRNHFHAPPDES